MSAASTVLSIAELVQHILSELPPLDIIRCQRVNSTWHELIHDSPTLQYKAWLRNDCPDPAQLVQAEDLMPKTLDVHSLEDALDIDDESEFKSFHYNISKHLNPIVVARIMQNPPHNPGFCFSPLEYEDKDGFGGYLHFSPVLMRDLIEWYEKFKSSEHQWGRMSLYRPSARKISWQTPTSGGAGIDFHLQSSASDDLEPGSHATGDVFHVTQDDKPIRKPPFLTLSDLMGSLDHAWDEWIDAEYEEHYLSHDGEGCDFDMGIPPPRCLMSNNEDDGVDLGSDKKGEDEDENERVTFGTKMAMENHIDRAAWAASF